MIGIRSLKSLLAAAIVTLGIVGSAQAAVSNFYWTNRDAATLNKTTAANVTTQLVAPTGGRLQDVDISGSTLYFTDWGMVGPPGGQGGIYSVSTSGGAVTPILTGVSDAYHQIALDLANNDIYYTQGVSYETRHVGVYDTVTLTDTILQDDTSWFPSGIGLDGGFVYWGDIGILTRPIDGTVNRMTTAGAGATVLEPHLNGRGRAYAIYAGDIYLTAHDPLTPATNGSIYRYNISSDTLVTLIPTEANGFWDIEIDTTATPPRMYWTNYAAGKIESALLDGSDRQDEVIGLTFPYGLAIETTGVPASSTLTLVVLFVSFAAVLALLSWRRRDRVARA